MPKAMKDIKEFEMFSGFEINGQKSILVPHDSDSLLNLDHVDLKVSQSFDYLGLKVSPNVGDYIALNFGTLIDKIET